jgi:hypothetical protein
MFPIAVTSQKKDMESNSRDNNRIASPQSSSRSLVVHTAKMLEVPFPRRQENQRTRVPREQPAFQAYRSNGAFFEHCKGEQPANSRKTQATVHSVVPLFPIAVPPNARKTWCPFPRGQPVFPVYTIRRASSIPERKQVFRVYTRSRASSIPPAFRVYTRSESIFVTARMP